MTLADADIGRRLRILDLEVERDAKGWLDAVGLHSGEEIVVLRRAILGGPLHVRTSSGGEFAVARELATHILVRATEDGTK